MHSHGDGIRAGELYIKLGKRVRPTIRQLGYPPKNALKGWYREYQQRLDRSGKRCRVNAFRTIRHAIDACKLSSCSLESERSTGGIEVKDSCGPTSHDLQREIAP